MEAKRCLGNLFSEKIESHLNTLLKRLMFIKERFAMAYRRYRFFIGKIKSRNKTKYFCIGRNKTGTTSLKTAFEQLGFLVGDQRSAELLYDRYYFENNFEPIIEYSRSAQVFQDVPFSCPETYKYLDRAYPGSKFILTVRDDAEQWYSSITRFHAKKFGRNGRIPTSGDLKSAEYIRRGLAYNTVRLHGTSDDDPYNHDIMTAHYEKYNRDVMEYFKDRPEDLLVLNIAEEGAYQNFVNFLGVDSPYDSFPWENRS